MLKTPANIRATNSAWRKKHLPWFADYMRKYRKKRKRAGLCIQCGIPRSEWEQLNSPALCARCEFKALVHQQKRRKVA